MSQTTIATTDSPETGRSAINANFTELYAFKNATKYVDIPIVIQVGGSFGSQVTNYSGLGSAVALSSAESSVPYSPFGITGTVVGMYFQSKTNTQTQSTIISLESGAADATDLTTSNLTITVGAGVKNASVTDQTLAITPTMIGGLKFVNASGSGTITLITITLVVRVSLTVV